MAHWLRKPFTPVALLTAIKGRLPNAAAQSFRPHDQVSAHRVCRSCGNDAFTAIIGLASFATETRR